MSDEVAAQARDKVDEFVSELHSWADKDSTNHRLSRLLRNTALKLTLMDNALGRASPSKAPEMPPNPQTPASSGKEGQQ